MALSVNEICTPFGYQLYVIHFRLLCVYLVNVRKCVVSRRDSHLKKRVKNLSGDRYHFLLIVIIILSVPAATWTNKIKTTIKIKGWFKIRLFLDVHQKPEKKF